MRSRIHISKEKKQIILCNQKNGYSSINALLDPNDYSRDITHPKELKKFLTEDNTKYNIIYIKREPYDRFCSYYSNWLVDKGEKYQFRGREENNIHYKNLKKFMPQDLYSTFINDEKLSQQERLLLFLDYFHEFYDLDTHTLPQTNLYKNAALSVNDLHIIDLNNLSTELSKLLKMKFEIKNKSSNKNNYFFNDYHVLEKWNETYVPLYLNDYKELEYEIMEITPSKDKNKFSTIFSKIITNFKKL